MFASTSTQKHHSLEDKTLYIVGEKNSDGWEEFVLYRIVPESEKYTQSIGTVASVQRVGRDAIVYPGPRPEEGALNTEVVRHLTDARNSLIDIPTQEFTLDERKRFVEISKELRELKDDVHQRRLQEEEERWENVLNEAFGAES